ncbi:hypothetical protein BVG19_g1756 [[Candida] boidinii]|nr:hypothetical protein BVG19_g1756 [[Candida] boidinii]OWB48771.1 hypothetical protein B5S27_g306 [[Candida] boidinii]
MTRNLPSIRVITDPPTVENTISITEYKKYAPSTFGLDDKTVLYSGGHNFKLKIQALVVSESEKLVLPFQLNPTRSSQRTLNLNEFENFGIQFSQDLDEIKNQMKVSEDFLVPITIKCWFFVLNSNVIIWLDSLKFGFEIPYYDIILFAYTNKSEGVSNIQSPEIYFQFNCNGVFEELLDTATENAQLNNGEKDDSMLSSYLIPESGITGSTSNNSIPSVFTSLFYNDTNDQMQKIYQSLLECSSLFPASFSDDSEEEGGVDHDEATTIIEENFNGDTNIERSIPQFYNGGLSNVPTMSNTTSGPDSESGLIGSTVILHNSGCADDLGEDDLDDQTCATTDGGMDVDVIGGFTSTGTKRRPDEGEDFDDKRSKK